MGDDAGFCGPYGLLPVLRDGDLSPCFQSVLLSTAHLVFMLTVGVGAWARLPPVDSASLLQADEQPRKGICVGMAVVSSGDRIRIALSLGIALLTPVAVSLQPHRAFGFVLYDAGALSFSWTMAAVLLYGKAKRMLKDGTALRIFWLISMIITAKMLVTEVIMASRGEQLGINLLTWKWWWVCTGVLRLLLQFSVWFLTVRKEGCLNPDIRFNVDEEVVVLEPENERQPLLRGASSRRTMRSGIPNNSISIADSGSSSYRDLATSALVGESRSSPAREIWTQFLISGSPKTQRKPANTSQDRPNSLENVLLRTNDIQSQTGTRPQSSIATTLQVSVPTWIEVASSNKSALIVKYAIKVKSSCAGSWTIWKRYSELLGFHEQLSFINRKNKTVDLPNFPPKSSNPDMAERAKSLEIYFLKLLSIPEIESLVSDFLGQSERIQGLRKINGLPRPLSLESSSENDSHQSSVNTSLLISSNTQDLSTDILGSSETTYVSNLDASDSVAFLVLSVKFLDEELLTSTSGDIYPVFRISVTTTIGTWIVHKRNKEILSLTQTLQDRFRHSKTALLLPQCPSDLETLSASMSDLQRYFDSLLSTTELNCMEITSFFQKQDASQFAVNRPDS